MLRLGVRAVAATGWTAGCLLYASARSLDLDEPGRHRVFRRAGARWSTTMLSLFGFRVRRDGELPAPPDRGRLVVSNHRSPFDIFILYPLMNGRFLARSDMAQWPMIGPAAKGAGTVFVDRQSRHSRTGALRKIHQLLKQRETVIVFPEGTTFGGDEVRSFSRGPFAPAIEYGADIVPVGLAYPPGREYTDASLLDHASRVGGAAETTVGLAIGTPFKATGDASDLTARARQEVQALTHKARTLQSPR